MRSYLTHLECSACGEHFDADEILGLCPMCQKPLLARYDLTTVRRILDRSDLPLRQPNLWRYKELLPIRDSRYMLTMGEGWTPLLTAHSLGESLGFHNLYMKDEGQNPTGSFKARGLGVAVSRAYELGIKEVSIPSAGNAAGALAAYAARASLQAHVYMPKDVPNSFVTECRVLGANVMLVDGLITDCGRISREEAHKQGWFDISTLKEPYRLEGKKTMGYEVAEQMNWELPDVMIYPTGGGTGLIGMWKAFSEMEELGWIGSERPRMVAVQPHGCAPIVKAFHEGKDTAEIWKNAQTVAEGLRVPAAVGDFLMLKVIRESHGTAVSVSDEAMLEACDLLGHTEGIFSCPEGGATLAAFKVLRDQGWIHDRESVVLFITGSGHKYSHLWSNA